VLSLGIGVAMPRRRAPCQNYCPESFRGHDQDHTLRRVRRSARAAAAGRAPAPACRIEANTSRRNLPWRYIS